MKMLITGSAGFTGSHVVRRFIKNYPNYSIFNLHKLTYASNLENLKDIEHSSNYKFLKGDVVDETFVFEIFREFNFDGIIHLAVESHIDCLIKVKSFL